MLLGLLLVLIFFNLVNVVLHSIGAYLLIYSYKYENRSFVATEQIYIINLAICELVLNILQILQRLLELFMETISTQEGQDISSAVQGYTSLVTFTGIAGVFYINMIYLTLDRVMLIMLNIKYPVYWNEVKTKWLLYTTWFLGIILSVSIALAHHLLHYDWETHFFIYVYPSLDIFFVVVAIFAYTFLFRQFVQTRVLPTTVGQPKLGRRNSSFQIFRSSRFYVSVWLILTFLIFMVVPDLVMMSVTVQYDVVPDEVAIPCFISYAISNMADAFIYIFTERRVRRLFMRKVLRREPNSVEPTTNHQHEEEEEDLP